jgi:hypothetical protein
VYVVLSCNLHGLHPWLLKVNPVGVGCEKTQININLQTPTAALRPVGGSLRIEN